MKSRKPDLRETKTKLFVTDQGGDVKLVSTVEKSETYLEENSILEESSTNVEFRCDLCGQFAETYTHLEGERIGFECGCARLKVKKILSDQFWHPGSHKSRDIEKALEIRRLMKSRGRSKFLQLITNVFAKS